MQSDRPGTTDEASPDPGVHIIETVIQTVLASTTPSAGDDLLGFQIDAELELSNETFVNANVRQTGRAERMLEMSAELAPHVSTLHQVRTAVWTLWGTLRYGDFDATHWSFGEENVVFRFVTAVPEVSLCVTGRLVVGGPHYARLARKAR